ncbi:MAG: DUF502 domain-containing protein [candidate division FCPU426 bacterium]
MAEQESVKKPGLKGYFITGLFSVLPLIFTVWVALFLLRFAWNSVFSLLVPLVDQGLLFMASPATVELWRKAFLPELTGFLLILVIILTAGFVATHLFGRSLQALVDKVMGLIPGVNWIYGTIRQFSSTMDPASPRRDAFSRPVLVTMEMGYVLGFMTSRSLLKGKPMATVFFPCNQLVQGYNLVVEESRCIPLEMSVDEAVKYVVSFGLMAPPVFASRAKVKKIKAQNPKAR